MRQRPKKIIGRLKNKIQAFLLIALSLFLIFAFFGKNAFSQTEEEAKIYLTEVDGEIKAGTFQYLKRAVREAKKTGAEYLIVKLDTPGGLLKPTKDIIDLFLEAEIKTVVFVHKEAGWAYSAGTFILMAADFAFVHPSASIGACQPQEMFGQEEAGDKLVEGMVSWIKSLAQSQERNPEIAEKFVRENLTLTGKEAEEGKVIDGTAKNLDDLFLKLEIEDFKIKVIKPTFLDKLFDFLSHPYLVSLFLTVGGLAIIMAIRTGEFELTGIIGLVSLLIGFWGIGIINFSFFGAGLILLGLFLLMMEIFEPGFGIFGIAGGIIIILGIFTFSQEPFFSPKLFDAVTMIVLGAFLAICFLFVIIGREAGKTLKAKPKTGSESLIDLLAETIEDLKPQGRIKLLPPHLKFGADGQEETWLAQSIGGEEIAKGKKVKIINIDGSRLLVKKVE